MCCFAKCTTQLRKVSMLWFLPFPSSLSIKESKSKEKKGTLGVPPIFSLDFYFNNTKPSRRCRKIHSTINCNIPVTTILNYFKCRCRIMCLFIHVFMPSPCVHFNFFKSESLIRKVLTLGWYSGNSSLCMFIHIKLFKQPTHTSCSNK